jgi:hypothetical protein
MSLEQLSPLSETVKLISSDGFEFIIDRRTAMGSGTIKNMLSSPGIYILSYQDNLQNLSRMKSTLEI